jgi:hypothetical protein
LTDSSRHIQVACRSGRSYADRPTSFVLNGERYDIDGIEREWLEPDGKHFIVKATVAGNTEMQKRYHICYDTREDLWRLCENQ